MVGLGRRHASAVMEGQGMGLKHGIFGWADLASPDIDGAAEFYNKVMGWDAVPAEGGMPYTMFSIDGKSIAGMGELTDEMAAGGMPPVWSSYIIVDDVDVVHAKAIELGATPIMDVMEIPGSGRMSFVIDPVGAAIGFWEDGGHAGADVFNVNGAMTWNELQCRDVDTAAAFYTELLGWETETNDMGGMAYTVVNNAGRANGGMMDITGLAPDGVPSYWMTYFVTDDVDASVARAKEAGGSVIMEPMDSPEVGRFVTIADPYGAPFTLIQANQVDGQPPR